MSTPRPTSRVATAPTAAPRGPTSRPTAPARRPSRLSDRVVDALRAAGCVFAEDEAAVLRESATSPAHLDALLARRVAGVPLEVVVGWVSFAGIRVLIDPGVFVPRRRSELLVDVTVASSPALVVDLCCGSGAVGAAILQRLRGIDMYAADVDPAAVACARRNLPPERVFEGDLYDALPSWLRGRVDVLVANAPYVPTDSIAMMPSEARDHEPRVALDGGADGVELHRRIAASARDWLAPGGRLVIETSRAQAKATATAMTNAGLATRVGTDDDRHATAVVGTVV